MLEVDAGGSKFPTSVGGTVVPKAEREQARGISPKPRTDI